MFKVPIVYTCSFKPFEKYKLIFASNNLKINWYRLSSYYSSYAVLNGCATVTTIIHPILKKNLWITVLSSDGSQVISFKMVEGSENA
jgi:hypothetical protein